MGNPFFAPKGRSDPMTEKKTTTTAQKQPDGIITTQRNGQTIVAELFSITEAQKHSATSC